VAERSKVIPIFRSAFMRPEDEHSQLGIRPVVFDIIAPDGETSVLPDGLKMVMHVNPNTFKVAYSKVIERLQTKGGWVEQHWGEGVRNLTFDAATGGFKRLYSGLSNITGGGYDAGGTRRQTIAYDKYLNLLAMFLNNGAIRGDTGQIAFQGMIKVTFDGGVYFGWFGSFNVEEGADNPYQFTLSTDFTISHEILRLRSGPLTEGDFIDPRSPELRARQAEQAALAKDAEPAGSATAERRAGATKPTMRFSQSEQSSNVQPPKTPAATSPPTSSPSGTVTPKAPPGTRAFLEGLSAFGPDVLEPIDIESFRGSSVPP